MRYVNLKCKYCNIVELFWKEPYKKGDKPREVETNREHTKDRCEWYKKGTLTITRKGGFVCGLCEKSFYADYTKYMNHLCSALKVTS